MNSKYQVGQTVEVKVWGKGQGVTMLAVIEDVELDSDFEDYFVRFQAGNGTWANVHDLREVREVA